MRHRIVISCVIALTGGLAHADEPAKPDEPVNPDAPAPWIVRPGMFTQPQFRLRENAVGAQNDTDGFRFARTRLFIEGTTHVGDLEMSAYAEAELQPAFVLFYAFATAAKPLPNGGRLTFEAGQMRVPISRENLISDTRLSFVDKAQLAALAPEPDLGVRLWFVPPCVRQLRVAAAVFNGEGKNQVQNINESYLAVGRVEFTPFGKDPVAESTFGGNYLTVAAAVGRNSLSPGLYKEIVTYAGGEIAGSWNGLSGAAEYLYVRHRDEGDAANLPDPSRFNANAWYAQLAYMPPLHVWPAAKARVEVAARVEEIDRNDKVPIVSISDPTNQSVRTYSAALSYYLRAHTLKVQATASHYTEIEDRTASGGNASYPNDQLLVQITYRTE